MSDCENKDEESSTITEGSDSWLIKCSEWRNLARCCADCLCTADRGDMVKKEVLHERGQLETGRVKLK